MSVSGIVAGLMLMAAIYVIARWRNLPAEPWRGFHEIIDGMRMDLDHAGYEWPRLVGHNVLSTSGVFGVPLDVAATYIVLFVIYGAVLEYSGAGRFFVDWALAATYTGKGISAELGHVDQLGNWEIGHQLDDAVRQLPASDVLADAGRRPGQLPQGHGLETRQDDPDDREADQNDKRRESIGKAIEQTAKKKGFKVITNLCSHGVGASLRASGDSSTFRNQDMVLSAAPGMPSTQWSGQSTCSP